MAFQTSCVSATNIVTGLTFQQDVVADAEGREMVQHGSALFPIACFVCYLPMVYLLFNESALFHCFMTAIPALAGNILGALWRESHTKRNTGKEDLP